MMSTKPLVRAIFIGPKYIKPNPKPQPVRTSPRIAAVLATPTWSVRSLLPPTTPSPSQSTKPEITREKLHHLLRLSALPMPKSLCEEEKLLKSLQDHLYFVKAIQKVNTRGVEPLRAIRDETEEAIEEQTIKLTDLQKAFESEEVVGRNGRIRTKRPAGEEENAVERTWDMFRLASGPNSTWKDRERVEVPGRRTRDYFVVRRARKTARPRVRWRVKMNSAGSALRPRVARTSSYSGLTPYGPKKIHWAWRTQIIADNQVRVRLLSGPAGRTSSGTSSIGRRSKRRRPRLQRGDERPRVKTTRPTGRARVKRFRRIDGMRQGREPG